MVQHQLYTLNKLQVDSPEETVRMESVPAAGNNNGVRKKRGRKKIQRKHNGELGFDNDTSENGEVDEKRKQEKIEQRRELMRKHMEEVKKQAVYKILNEKGKKEREREKKAKKEKEDQLAKEAAMNAKKKASLSNIHIKYAKDGSIALSFPQGFLLPQVLSQEKSNGTIQKKSLANNCCVLCGNIGKYRSSKNGSITCSLECYRNADLNL